MLRKRTFLFLSLSFLIPCKDLYSQGPRLTNTLLWRVSGNNLAKPSYLYGTMHLTDKRVFQLGDSLYKAIEQTEGFAAELDMNRLGMQMVNYLMADREAKRATEAVKVKDAVSAETWERYKDHLQDKFYKSADKITIDDLEEIKSSLESDLFKKGDMPTFLDAHLFGLARKQGKWVGGLEDFRDQLEHINAEDIEDKIQTALFDDKYYRSGIERMISIYNSQLLDSLDALMYRSENGHKDYIMIKRNLKMAKMMDSLSAVRSTFFAVGAAHLPGDSGVIALLQKKGFKITPVISSKKISADKYVVKSKESPWVPASIADSSYRLEMPGVAESMEVLKSMGLDMKMFFDISFMKMYITLGIGLPAERKKLGADSLFNSMRNRFFEKADNTKERNITVNDVDGKEYTASTADGELKLQVFMPGLEEVIVNAVFSLSKKSISDDETVKFFQSFSYLGFNKSTSEAGTEKTWSTLTYQNLLFSVDMPSKPRETKDVNSEEGKIVYTYQSLDVKNQVFYGMSVTSVKEGLYQPGIDSSYFLSVKDGLKTRMESSKFLDSSFVTSSGFTGYKASMSAKAQGEAIETKALWVVRGNRIYYIYAVYSPVESNRIAAERYLGSFKILPVNTTNWKTYTSPDSSFSVVSTLPLKKFSPDKDDFHWSSDRFIIYDSVIAATTYIDKTIIPEWCWFSSDTAFLRERANQYTRYNDSITGYTVSQKDNRIIVDFIVTTKASRLVYKVKFILSGNKLFELFGHFDPVDVENIYDRIFAGFKAERPGVRIDWSQTKINELARVLQNANLEETMLVRLWWNSLEFSKNDLPVLQTMLFKLYPDFDSGYNSDLNSLLLFKIESLDSLHTTVDYIKKNYSSITQENEYVKHFLVSYLAGITTAESYAVLKDALKNNSFNITTPVYLYGLYDSLELTATLFPDLLKYADSEALGSSVQSITTTLFDSGLISKKMIVDNSRKFIDYAKKKLSSNKENIETNGHNYYDCVQILGIINTPESNSLLARFAKFDNRGLRYQTLVAQLRNNQRVDSRTIYTMATTVEYRYDLYEELRKLKKQSLFPADYLSQEKLAYSKLYKDYHEDDEYSVAFKSAGTKTILYKGKQQKVYIYKALETEDYDYSLNDKDRTYYLAIAGPYSLNAKDYSSNHELTGIYWEKKYDEGKLDELIREYLESLEETTEEEIPPPPPQKAVK